MTKARIKDGGGIPGMIHPLRGDLTRRLIEKRPHVYTLVLRGALAGDPKWAEIFLQLTGDLSGRGNQQIVKGPPEKKAKLTAISSGPSANE